MSEPFNSTQQSAQVLGEATLDNNARVIVVRFVTDQGETEVISSPSEEFLIPPTIARILVRSGFPLRNAKPASSDLCEQVSKGSLSRAVLPEGSGWLPDFSAYVYGDEILGAPSSQVALSTEYLKSLKNQELGISKSAGSAEAWRNAMSGMPKHSYVVTFALAVGFAGIMVGALGGRPTIYNLFGETGDGKTVALRATWSIFGKCDEDDLPNWDASRPGLERVLRSAADIVVPIDELTFVNDRERAETLGQWTYSVGAGRTRTLARSSTGEARSARLRGSRLILSSGENSLDDTRQIAGKNRGGGELVRAIDIPSDAGHDNGILRYWPREHTAASYIRSIEDACSQNYGWPGREFIRYLLRTRTWKEDARRRMKRFDQTVGAKGRFEVRFASRFNIIYAAGLAAIRADVVDWDPSEFGHAVGRIYDKALSALPTRFAERDLVISKLLSFLRDSKALSAERGTPIDEETYRRTDVFRRDGRLVVKTDVLDSLCPNARVRDEVIGELARRGQLIRDNRGIATQQPSIRGTVAGKRPRYYVFREVLSG